MKRKYWIEAGIALIVLIVLYAAMLPKFKRAQVRIQPEKMQQYVKDVVAYCASHLDQLSNMGEIISGLTAGPYTNNKGEKVNIYLKKSHIYSGKEKFFSDFPSIEPPVWTSNDLAFVVQATYSLEPGQNVNQSITQLTFETQPSMIAVMAIIGNQNELSRWRINAELFYSLVGDDGYLEFHNTYTPYNNSNGLLSSGGIYADTTDIWPRKQAVLLGPPSEEPK